MLPHGYAILGQVLYIQGPMSGTSTANPVDAVDLRTGRQLWSRNIPGDAATIIDAGASGLHAIIEPPGTNSFRLATYALATGQVTYGNSITDARVTITTGDMIYLQGGYLADLPASTLPGTPEIVVMSGAAS